LKDFVLRSKVTGTDDTPVRVLDRSLKGTTRKGRFWPYVGDGEHPGVVYDYTATRERAGPEKFLQEYRGYLQVDAYSAYDRFFTDPERGLVEVACWAHTRRHFHDALDTDAARMGTVLAYIAKLYAVEKTARESGVVGEELRLLRQQGSVPVLEELQEYLGKISGEVLPKSEAGRAVTYARKNWEALTRYTQDGDLSIDNNHTERSIRGIAVGRNYVRSLIMCSPAALKSAPVGPDRSRTAHNSYRLCKNPRSPSGGRYRTCFNVGGMTTLSAASFIFRSAST